MKSFGSNGLSLSSQGVQFLAFDFFDHKNMTTRFKAALCINTFMLTKAQMTMCNVRGVTHSGEPTEDYHPTSILAVFSFFFYGFYGLQLYFFGL